MFGTQECYSSQTNAGIRYRDYDGVFFLSSSDLTFTNSLWRACQLLLPPAWSPLAHHCVLRHLVHHRVMNSRCESCETRPIITWLLFVMCKGSCLFLHIPLASHGVISARSFWPRRVKPSSAHLLFHHRLSWAAPWWTCTGATPSPASKRAEVTSRDAGQSQSNPPILNFLSVQETWEKDIFNIRCAALTALFSDLGETGSCFMEKIFSGFYSAALGRLCLKKLWTDSFTFY